MNFKLLTFMLPFLLAVAGFAEPQEIRVGTYILNVGKFDLAAGSYTVDFYLSMECDEPCMPDFEFMNGRAASVDKLVDNATSKFYRVQANLATNVDLRNYPFDSHALSIELEDKRAPADQLVWKPDPQNSGIDPSVVIVGWILDGSKANAFDHRYETFGETFSRYRFSILIHRAPLTSFMKILLPVFVMVIIALLAHLLKSDKVTQRLTVNTSTLLGAVLFHINATSSIPPVGYLTFADKFMIGTYVILGASLLSTVLLLRHTEKGDEANARAIYRLSAFLVPLLACIIYAGLFVFGLF